MTTAGDAHASMRRLPLATITALADGGDLLVLAPHADDEVLGCGGAICAAVAAGLSPAIVIVTDGTGSHPGSRRYPAPSLKALREAEARSAAAILGVTWLRFLGYTDTAAPRDGPAFEEAVCRIAALCREFRCRTICAPWQFDPHCDHLAAHLMAQSVAERLGIRHLSYPVWGWTLSADTPLGDLEIRGWRVPVAAYRAVKQRALAAHASQVGDIVDDDPTGFRLTDAILAQMTHSFEVFLTNP
jgi:LmbE family N-acetylglucosaminyl deacetylase